LVESTPEAVAFVSGFSPRSRLLFAAKSKEASMLAIWFGALLVLAGIVFMAAQPIRRGQLSGRRSRSEVVGANTLEPRMPAAGFDLATNWPGLVLVFLGAILLLFGAVL
jgi:hypothetical protein